MRYALHSCFYTCRRSKPALTSGRHALGVGRSHKKTRCGREGLAPGKGRAIGKSPCGENLVCSKQFRPLEVYRNCANVIYSVLNRVTARSRAARVR